MLANVLPENTTIKNVTWSVSPLSVASIDANGVLEAYNQWNGYRYGIRRGMVRDVKGTAAVTITNQNVGNNALATPK
jgi:hypothetical protein